MTMMMRSGEGRGTKVNGKKRKERKKPTIQMPCVYFCGGSANAPVTPRPLETNRAIALGEFSGSPFLIANGSGSGGGGGAAAGAGGLGDDLGDLLLAHSSNSLGVAFLPDVLGRATAASSVVMFLSSLLNGSHLCTQMRCASCACQRFSCCCARAREWV